MNISDAVSEYLPTKSQKVIWGMTAALTPASMFLYEALEKVGLPLVFLKEPQVRALLGLGVFSLGMASLNLLLIWHIHKQPTGSKAPPTSGQPAHVPPLAIVAVKPNPEPDSLLVLALLADDRPRKASEIASRTGLSVPNTKYHLDELERMRLVDSSLGGYPDVSWHIEAKGRACLKRLNLLP